VQDQTSQQQDQDQEQDNFWRALRPGEILPDATDARLDFDRCRLWALVLEARGINLLAACDEQGWKILVPAADLMRAEEEIRTYERKNRFWPPRIPSAPARDNLLTTFSLLLLLGIFHNLRVLETDLLGIASEAWIEAGAMQVQKVRDGQWWRVVTALSLHNGGLHLMANLAAGALFIGRLCRRSGTGRGWAMVLAAGALGNAINAMLQFPSHTAVGASTAIFGAVGILGTQGLFPRAQRRGLRRLLPVAAALGLLGLLGTSGSNTDVGAHLWGFAAGLLIGWFSFRNSPRQPQASDTGDLFFGVAALALFLFCWWLALTSPG
jgi:membrane associated rhomboid family serine protease